MQISCKLNWLPLRKNTRDSGQLASEKQGSAMPLYNQSQRSRHWSLGGRGWVSPSYDATTENDEQLRSATPEGKVVFHWYSLAISCSRGCWANVVRQYQCNAKHVIQDIFQRYVRRFLKNKQHPLESSDHQLPSPQQPYGKWSTDICLVLFF